MKHDEERAAKKQRELEELHRVNGQTILEAAEEKEPEGSTILSFLHAIPFLKKQTELDKSKADFVDMLKLRMKNDWDGK